MVQVLLKPLAKSAVNPLVLPLMLVTLLLGDVTAEAAVAVRLFPPLVKVTVGFEKELPVGEKSLGLPVMVQSTVSVCVPGVFAVTEELLQLTDVATGTTKVKVALEDPLSACAC
jgi:hypothetical protein